jgi:molybdopterin-containing oxidoreductase family membrane subunit
MAKVTLATGLIVAYAYVMEVFFAWYSGNTYEKYLAITTRPSGPYWWAFWALWTCNIVVPQSLWFKKIRTSPILLWIIALIINVGMWLERFVIIVTSLHRDYLPSSWGMYTATRWEYMLFFGTIGLFLALMFLFIRSLPLISIFEMRTLVPEAAAHSHEEHV